MRTVIFDLDGTLADTSGDLIAAANACFRAEGHGDQLDSQADASTAFHGGRAMLRLGFARLGFEDQLLEDAIERCFRPLLSFYEDEIDRYTRLYPGAMEAVETLRVTGVGVGICTNKPEGLAETLLQRLGVRAAFGSLIGADTLPVRKPDPLPLLEAVTQLGGQPERALLVGDTVTDRKTALAAKMPCILVTFGPDGQGVSRLAPEALLDNYAELPALVEKLLP